jgi:putative ABC transport system substrate-binding protein
MCVAFGALLQSPSTAADQVRKTPIVGEIWFSDPTTVRPWDVAFRDGLHELGYVDGKNMTIVMRYANGDVARLPALLSELIALPVDVLVVNSKVVKAATASTKTIPIVCPSMGDPVRDGLVASLQHPGGNLTGGYGLIVEMQSKLLELTAELVPNISRIDVVFDADDASDVADAEEFRRLARRVEITARTLGVRDLKGVHEALKTIDRDRAQALIVFDDPLTDLHREPIMRFAQRRLPVISDGKDWAKAGAVLTYAPNYYEMWRRGAVYVDKIIKGAKAGDLAIEQPTKLELVVNLKTAKALGITIPESILLRADEVIR